MKLILSFTFIALNLFISCKKDHTCTCTNSLTTYDAGTTNCNKTQAKKYCKSLSEGETKCEIKN
jgi:hypothetical protein